MSHFQHQIVDIEDIFPYERNPRTHSKKQIEQLVGSIKEFGFTNPVLIDEKNKLIAGHGRLQAAQSMGMQDVPAVTISNLDEDQRRALVIADNKLALEAGWDTETLIAELQALGDKVDLAGFTSDELEALIVGNPMLMGGVAGAMTDDFIQPPFSVLDARKGDWIERKKKWLAIIGDQSKSREGVLGSGSLMESINSGTSIFDPVLAEIIVAWFGKKDGKVFDPFAGGSAFGVVSGMKGMQFTGIELRQEQAALNQQRVDMAEIPCVYHCDTGENMDAYIDDNSQDMIFTCPPYADLEVYSDDPNDLSNMSHDEFFNVYKRILQNTFAKLKDNRFAVIVMGEVRNKDGAYIGTIPKTIQIMEEAGYIYYNEIILVTSIGTLPIRAGKTMRASRKVGKTHQNILVFLKCEEIHENILVFLKGDAKQAVSDLGSVNVDESEDLATLMKQERKEANTQQVKVSAKMAMTKFIACEPGYIAEQCHGSCCQSSTRPSGTMITIHPSEIAMIESLGASVTIGLLDTPNKVCQFKTSDSLCGLHGTGKKPFGCIASPFTLNKNGTLIVRNRYKMLKCYKDKGDVPAYKNFRASLDLIFGIDESRRICDHLDGGGGDVMANMPNSSFDKLLENDEIKHQ